MYEKVNGYDETFLGAWREDDDFGRRVHLAGGSAKVAVRDCRVYHLWHPLNPQKRENWAELPSTTSSQPWLPRAGLTSPLPQSTLLVEQLQ
jgi:GT2 family glycosyltransferase